MKASAAGFICFAGLAACGPGNLDGSVQGHKITLQSAIFASYTMTGTVVGTNKQVLGPAVDAILSDDPNACGSLKDGVPFHPAHTYLFMHINQQYYTQQGVSTVPEVAAGYYSAQDPTSFDGSKQGGSALFYFKSAGCQGDDANLSTESYGLDGGILVNDISPSAGGSLSGDIDVKVGSHGDDLKGTVHMSYCTALESYLKQDGVAFDPGAWTCQ